jgi:hypothetical protein
VGGVKAPVIFLLNAPEHLYRSTGWLLSSMEDNPGAQHI